MAESIKTAFVIDCSIVSANILPDETLPKNYDLIFKKFLKNRVKFLAPHLLKFEVGNVLKVAYSRKRLNPQSIRDLYSEFLALPIIHFNIDPKETLKIALENNLSFYDASYLELSLEQNAPLLTLDKKLTSLSP